MKKNISINISGIIFHIEEDGYDMLKNYLDSISNYFSSFTDSKEIVSDIESRIAEIFLAKLKEDKQVITKEDIEALMATMGSVEDFQVIEETLEDESDKKERKNHRKQQKQYRPEPPRDLKRDESRKILGGVCAGIAYYFNIDPLWVRLLALVLFLGSYGVLFIVYVILWVVLPANYEVKESKDYKKMFRDPDQKVIAGVAAGVANYFGVENWIIRLLFLIFLVLGGSGLFVYIVLWIILPEARSITEKVQMQGEPVTLSNIESNIKKGLNVEEGEEESAIVKILLFPFRLIATIINGLGKVLGPVVLFLVEFLRVLIGVVMTVAGIFFLFISTVIAGIVSGLYNGDIFFIGHNTHLQELKEPFFMIFDSVPGYTFFVAFVVCVIPLIFLVLLGISVILKRIVFNAVVGWTLFGMFIVGGIYLSVTIPGIALGYHEERSYEEEMSFPMEYNSFVLTTDDLKGFENYNETDLWFEGHDGESVIAKMDFSSMGSSRRDALEHAKMIEYNIVQNDSVLTFDGGISLKEGGVFKFQELDITLFLPYDKPFIMDRSMRELLNYRAIERYGYRRSQVKDENTWIFTESGLECLTCEKHDDGWDSRDRDQSFSRIITTDGFNSIEVNSPIKVEVRKGNDYRVEIRGKEEYINNILVEDIQNILDITDTEEFNTARNFQRSRDAVTIYITTPELGSIDINQASVVSIKGLEGNSLSIDMNGASKAEMDVDYDQLELSLNGSSKLELSGRGNHLSAEVNGNSDLDSYNYRVRTAEIGAHGASNARLFASETIEISKGSVSSVRVRGGAREIVKE